MDRQFFQMASDDGRLISPNMQAELERFGAVMWPPLSVSANAELPLARTAPRALVKSGRPVLRLAELLDLLLLTDVQTDGPVAAPIWRDYASHLALKLMQLYLTRQPVARTGSDAIADQIRRSRQFANLSTFLQPIFHPQANYSAPLDHTLGNLAVALCELFPPPSGKVRLFMDGLSLRLPGLSHRVVTAVGLELLLNVLQHGFFSGASGDVYMIAGRQSPQTGFLLVADNGRGVGCHAPGEGFRLINRLAGLIGGETVLRGAGAKGTEVQARFSVALK